MIPKRFILFNTNEKYQPLSTSISKERNARYACEKCGQLFNTWKNLRLHKIKAAFILIVKFLNLVITVIGNQIYGS